MSKIFVWLTHFQNNFPKQKLGSWEENEHRTQQYNWEEESEISVHIFLMETKWNNHGARDFKKSHFQNYINLRTFALYLMPKPFRHSTESAFWHPTSEAITYKKSWLN